MQCRGLGEDAQVRYGLLLAMVRGAAHTTKCLEVGGGLGGGSQSARRSGGWSEGEQVRHGLLLATARAQCTQPSAWNPQRAGAKGMHERHKAGEMQARGTGTRRVGDLAPALRLPAYPFRSSSTRGSFTYHCI